MAITSVTLFAACSDGVSPNPPPPPPSLIVSNPLPASALAAAGNFSVSRSAASAAAADSIVYVSLTPRMSPTGTSAIVQRVGSDVSYRVLVFDGGFDPFPLVAHVGDSIDIVVTGAAGQVVLHSGLAVAARRPPIVVRTQPPPGKRDQPLNAAIIIVFSEPVEDPAARPGSVRLLRGADDIAGTVQFLEPSLGTGDVSVEFVPSAPLQADAPYRLIVTQQVRDLTGDALSAPDTVEFTTSEARTGPPAALFLSIDSAVVLDSATTLQLTATVLDAASNELTDQPVTWSSGDTTVANVTPRGLVRAVAPGITLLSASSGQSIDHLWIIVSRPDAFVTIDPPEDSIDVGQELLLTATVHDRLGQPMPGIGITTWSVSDPSRAVIIDLDPHTAKLYGGHSGPVTVAATAVSGVTGSSKITIVSRLASLTVAPDSLTLLLAATRPLIATLKDSAGGTLTGYRLEWLSDNPTVATVYAPGYVTAVSSGSTTISVSSEGFMAEAHVVVPTVRFASVSAGAWHTCGVTVDGAAYCWGWIHQSQPGSRDTSQFSLVPVPIIGDHQFSAVTAGGVFTGAGGAFACGVTTAATAYCWGSNYDGELGRDHVSSVELTPDTIIASATGPLRFSQVSAGSNYACGVTVQNAAYCWGGNPSGPLGPIAIPGGLSFETLSAGAGHTCGVAADGSAYCWGLNDSGQLGDSTTTNRSVPVTVWGGLRFAELRTGGSHTCGVSNDGAAYCWGANDSGQLGDSTTTRRTTPTAVRGGLSFATLSAGESHTCGVTSDGRAFCWGLNASGQLGDGTTTSRRGPVPVAGGLTFATVSAGGGHTCGMTTGGVLYCWGLNDIGFLGDGTKQNRTMPVKVLDQP